jgi:predicted nucleic acid-binding Zn ribbon protein
MNRSEAGYLGWLASQESMEAKANELKQTALAHWLGEDKHCKNCGLRIPYEKRNLLFCDQSCSAKHSNRNRTQTHDCASCSKAIPLRRTYCSIKCQRNFEYEKYIKEWLADTVSGGKWSGVSSPVHRWLRAQRGEICWECGWSRVNPISGRVPIQVDHVDGNPYNHRPENLRLLCPSCHSLTPSYGILNRGKGRKERK